MWVRRRLAKRRLRNSKTGRVRNRALRALTLGCRVKDPTSLEWGRWANYGLTALLQLRQHLLGNLFECVEHTLSLKSNGLNHRLILFSQLSRQGVDRKDVGQVALVELQDIGNLEEIVAVFFKV